MRKILLSVLLVSLAAAAQADTIYLKNGSIIKGKVTGFAEDQFTVLIDAGGGRFMSRATIYTGDVSRIEFDSVPVSESAPPRETPKSTQTDPPPRVPEVSVQPPESEPTKPEKSRSEKAKSEKTEPEPEKTEPEKTEPEKAAPPPIREPAEIEQPRKETPSRTQEVEVLAKQDWTSTRILLSRGDRVVINATGTVNLDEAGARTSGPEGIDLADQRKLMTDQPTGALIAVIGADNDDFIFIGRSVEFTATRSGLLFLSINEGLLSDNNGSFKAVIEIYSSQKNK
ncbi:MAG: hypothetical protein AB1631_19470 [Acidobacteriota bacterium]